MLDTLSEIAPCSLFLKVLTAFHRYAYITQCRHYFRALQFLFIIATLWSRHYYPYFTAVQPESYTWLSNTPKVRKLTSGSLDINPGSFIWQSFPIWSLICYLEIETTQNKNLLLQWRGFRSSHMLGVCSTTDPISKPSPQHPLETGLAR